MWCWLLVLLVGHTLVSIRYSHRSFKHLCRAFKEKKVPIFLHFIFFTPNQNFFWKSEKKGAVYLPKERVWFFWSKSIEAFLRYEQKTDPYRLCYILYTRQILRRQNLELVQPRGFAPGLFLAFGLPGAGDKGRTLPSSFVWVYSLNIYCPCLFFFWIF